MKRTVVAALFASALCSFVRAWAAPPPLRVGSKAFAESVILGEAAGLLAAAAGAPVDDRPALGGTRLCWDALIAGALDVYPEYTGTLREEILSDAAAPGDLARLRAALAARGIGFIGPLGFDNHYALAMREPAAARLGIRTISDLAGAGRCTSASVTSSCAGMTAGPAWPRATACRRRKPRAWTTSWRCAALLPARWTSRTSIRPTPRSRATACAC